LRVSAFLQLYKGIDLLNVDEEARACFKKYVSQFASAEGIDGVERDERVAFAKRLRREGVSRTTIKDRLMARYEISKSQAYRVIDKALQTVA
jgi:hypothetical protein